jgi:hypothetical protein
METRRKLVVKMMILGARDRTVMRSSSCRENATSLPDSGFLILRSMKGMTGLCGGAGMAVVAGLDTSGKPASCAFSITVANRKNKQNTRNRECLTKT